MKTQFNLDDIRIATPCHARWNDMAGDDRARFCGQCSKHVFNLSAMTRGEIETLIREKEGKFCGRFYQRPDGRMLTADCPTGRQRRRSRLALLGGAVFATVMFLFGARATLRAKETNETRVLLGEMPVRMGDFAAPPITGRIATPTNPPTVKTNPPVARPREIMGIVALPPQTNPPTPPKN